jgi:hypothetical protein
VSFCVFWQERAKRFGDVVNIEKILWYLFVLHEELKEISKKKFGKEA